MKRNCKKLVKKNIRIEKITKRKGDKFYVKWKGYDNSFNSWIDKKTMNKILSNSVSLYKNESILSNLSNHATKADLKNITDVDTSNIALKTNLASLKSEVDKLDIEKLAPVPVDWSKLGDVVKNDVVQITVYDKLAANCIDTSDFVLKTKYHTGETELEKKIPDVTDFVKKTKLTEFENKIPDVSSLATKTALTAVENKIPSVSSLVKKTVNNTQISGLKRKLTDHNHDKYITTPEFNTLAADVFNARLAQPNLITKTDFDAK